VGEDVFRGCKDSRDRSNHCDENGCTVGDDKERKANDFAEEMGEEDEGACAEVEDVKIAAVLECGAVANFHKYKKEAAESGQWPACGGGFYGKMKDFSLRAGLKFTFVGILRRLPG